MTTYEKLRAWLSEQAEKKGTSTLLKQVGAPKSTFYRVCSGGSPPGADAFLDWMEKLGVRFALPDESLESYTMIPKVMAKAGAGSSLITEGDVLGIYAFRNDFLNSVGIHAQHSIMLDVMGDSMEPLIRNQDTILVDQSARDLKDGKIFLVGFGDELLVKRVQRTPRGWLLRSENKNFRDVPVEGVDLDMFRVYGRVRWFGRVL